MTNDERLRIELAKALVRAGGDEPGDLFEWHACVDTSACAANRQPAGPCACAGIPYLSEAAWREILPVLRRIQQGATR